MKRNLYYLTFEILLEVFENSINSEVHTQMVGGGDVRHRENVNIEKKPK